MPIEDPQGVTDQPETEQPQTQQQQQEPQSQPQQQEQEEQEEQQHQQQQQQRTQNDPLEEDQPQAADPPPQADLEPHPQLGATHTQEQSEQEERQEKEQKPVEVEPDLQREQNQDQQQQQSPKLQEPEQQRSTSEPTKQEEPVLPSQRDSGTPPKPPLDEDDDEEDEEEEDGGDNDDAEDSGRRSDYHRQEQPTGVAGARAAGSATGGTGSTASGGAGYYEDDEEDEEEEGEEQSELRQLFEPTNDSQALSEDEEDGDYIPDEEVKKTIMVGSDFQAVIPEGLCRYDDALPYENEDKLLWNPTILNEQAIEEYLTKVATGLGSAKVDPQSNSVYTIPLGRHLRDDEQSLYLLQQCGHNIDEALRRRRINAVPVSEQQMSQWSEEECRNFENGLRIHGKDFHMIQQSKVRTRSVGELVQFYYLWKKTERHDLFASKARLEKKKYNLHPGLTDHMDRFLEEQENSTGFGDRSSSPGFNSLYSNASDAKRQRLMDSKENTSSSKRAASNL